MEKSLRELFELLTRLVSWNNQQHHPVRVTRGEASLEKASVTAFEQDGFSAATWIPRMLLVCGLSCGSEHRSTRCQESAFPPMRWAYSIFEILASDVQNLRDLSILSIRDSADCIYPDGTMLGGSQLRYVFRSRCSVHLCFQCCEDHK